MARLSIMSIATLASLAAASSALAGTPTLDGTTSDAAYGAVVATQTVQTQFGDASGTAADTNGNGSELDNMHITDDTDKLYIALAGNFQTNGNFAAIFLDVDGSAGTGASSITGSAYGQFNGVTLPSNFGVDLILTPNAGGPGQSIYINSYVFSAAGAAIQDNYMGNTAGSAGNPTVGSVTNLINGTTATIDLALNNANAAGVEGGGAASAQSASSINAVSTGLEVGIPKDLLRAIKGSTLGTIKVFAAITSGGSPAFFSNQTLPALTTPAGNLGNSPNLSSALVPASYTMTANQAGIADYQLY